jgi:hypothetical protein
LAEFDLIVIGSGFGGAMAAGTGGVRRASASSLLNQADWVARGPHNWGASGLSEKTPVLPPRRRVHPSAAAAIVDQVGTYACVGGAIRCSTAASRCGCANSTSSPIRPSTRTPARHGRITTAISSRSIHRHETLLGVAGQTGDDPTGAQRDSVPYPRKPGPLAPIRIASGTRPDRSACIRFVCHWRSTTSLTRTARRVPACGTCDGFACAVQAKNDVSVILVPSLIQAGLELVINTTVVRLEHSNGRVTSVLCTRRDSGETVRYSGRNVAVAAGALSTPRLLLGSGLDSVNPAGDLVGRYLMRHCNAVVMGLFPTRPAPNGEFHKQLGIHDYYFGHPSISSPSGRLGCMQQFATPLPDIVKVNLPYGFGHVIRADRVADDGIHCDG